MLLYGLVYIRLSKTLTASYIFKTTKKRYRKLEGLRISYRLRSNFIKTETFETTGPSSRIVNIKTVEGGKCFEAKQVYST